MKKIYLTLLAFTFAFGSANAQVNLDLEQWTDNSPDGWFTFNQFMTFGLPQTVFQETADPGEGASSAEVITEDCPTCPTIDPSLSDTLAGVMIQDFALECTPTEFSFMYKYYPEGGSGEDEIAVGIQVFNWDETEQERVFVGFAFLVDDQEQNEWTTVDLVIDYDQYDVSQVPDSAEIFMISSASQGGIPGGPSAKKGTSAFVDDFSFACDDEEPNSINNYDAAQVNAYPNPASDVLNFDVEELNGGNIRVYDVTGRMIENVHISNSTMIMNVDNYNNGVYIYNISDANGDVVKTDKFVISK